LAERRVSLLTPIDDWVANTAVGQIRRLADAAPRAPLQLIVNSPGGYVSSTLVIYDVLEALTAPLETVCLKHASGTAALLVAAGTRGRRYCLPGATFTLCPIETSSRDLRLRNSIDPLHDRISELMAKRTGRSVEAVRADLMMNPTLSAQQAIAYGLIDAIDELAVGRGPGDPH
jgi:ATP-dependent Clp protease protease subunit